MSNFDKEKFQEILGPRKKTGPSYKWQLNWAVGFALTVFLLSFAFRHYYPSGMPVAGFAVQWWHLPIAGFAGGFLVPWDKLPFPLPLALMVFHLWGWILTALVWLVMVVHNAIAPAAHAWGLWRAPLIGIGISLAFTILYAACKRR